MTLLVICQMLSYRQWVENIFWITIAEDFGWRLQQNKLTGHCRILDPQNIRKAWGSKKAMNKALKSLEGVPKELKEERNCARYGDVIYVNRIKGIYQHYGI